jgi:hypothetical protein
MPCVQKGPGEARFMAETYATVVQFGRFQYGFSQPSHTAFCNRTKTILDVPLEYMESNK